MKQIFKPLILALLTLLPTTALAHDFEVDGIYYNIINDTEATVTYRGTSYYQYSNEYSGNMTIPTTITYNGTTYSVTSIGEYAFYSCSGLKSVNIPNSVTSIGRTAFSYCSGLTSINIPNSVTTIGSGAFLGTGWFNNQPDGLIYAGLVAYMYKGDMPTGTTISLRDGTIGIADYAFSYSSGLSSVNIPKSVTSIGDCAFVHCNELSIMTVESGNINYDSRNNCNAIIETTSNTLIAGCKNTTIPNSVTSIGKDAFSGCIDLTSVIIPNSVTSIGEDAFSLCSGLTSIDIPNSVTEICEGAFWGCAGLTSIDIPNSITQIGINVFTSCDGLLSMTVENGNPKYDSRNNCNAIIETASNSLIVGCKNTIIPNSVTIIGNSAFRECSSLSSVTIPNSVTTIGGWAFEGCTGLTSIDIPNSVTNIGEWAFESCSGLTSIDIPNSVTTIGDYAFSVCKGLTSIIIPNSVTSIGEWAFFDCDGLTSVSIGSFDSSIGNSTTSIGNYAFVDCNGLISATIGNAVSAIGEQAFSYCSSLTSITIGNSVTTIGEEAFYNCDRLTSVNITDLETWCSIQFSSLGCNPLSIARHLYLNGSEVTDLIIPNTVTSISNYAFEGCSGLTSVTIPNSVTSIGECAFFSCDGLTSVTIGGSDTSIGNSVTFGVDAFGYCSELTSVTISNSVTYIGGSAFSHCRELTSVTCLATTPPTIERYTFPNEVTSQATLYVPRESLSAYQIADYWQDFSQIVGMPAFDDFEDDGIWYRALNESTAMVIARPNEEYYQGDVVIPKTVTYQDITFAVTAIDEGAFEDCYDLSSVVIGDAVESISENAFEDCYDLNSVVIGDAVKTIGEAAFQGCTGLTSVTIGNGVTSIGAKAFNYCNALQTVTCRGTVPPAMASSNCFSTAAYNRAKLVVPRPEIETYSATDFWYKFSHIEGWGYLGPGDVNGSGTIDMDDLTRLINIMLTDDLDGIDPAWADVTGNGIVSMNDLTELINLLLTQ